MPNVLLDDVQARPLLDREWLWFSETAYELRCLDDPLPRLRNAWSVGRLLKVCAVALFVFLAVAGLSMAGFYGADHTDIQKAIAQQLEHLSSIVTVPTAYP